MQFHKLNNMTKVQTKVLTVCSGVFINNKRSCSKMLQVCLRTHNLLLPPGTKGLITLSIFNLGSSQRSMMQLLLEKSSIIDVWKGALWHFGKLTLLLRKLDISQPAITYSKLTIETL